MKILDRWFVYGFIGMLLLLVAVECNAAKGDMWLLLNGFSAHVGGNGMYTDPDTMEKRPFREFNPGLGIGYGLSEHWQARLGGYLGSYDNGVVYGGFMLHTALNKPVAIGLLGYGLYGYKDATVNVHYETIQPVIVPVLLMGPANMKTELGYVYNVKKQENNDPDSVITLTLSFKFR